MSGKIHQVKNKNLINLLGKLIVKHGKQIAPLESVASL